MKPIVFIGLLLSFNAITGLAAGSENQGAIIGHASFQVAQLSAEERRLLRERWEHADPEERAEIRHAFRERLRTAPPEKREALRNELLKKWKNLPPEERERLREQYQESRSSQYQDNDDSRGRSRGFGRGYERRYEYDSGTRNSDHSRGRSR